MGNSWQQFIRRLLGRRKAGRPQSFDCEVKTFRAMLAKKVPGGVSVVDELLAERRKELSEDLEELRRKYGEFPDSTPYLREERDG